MTTILGISAFFHDSAAALVVDGHIAAAAQEERFTRIKQDAAFPKHAIEYVLQQQGISLAQVDYIVFFEKPFLKFERLVETYIGVAPKGWRQFLMGMPIWISEKLFMKKLLLNSLRTVDASFTDTQRIMFSEHHLSHAASAFYPSPFEKAAVLTIDGVGEWATTTISMGEGAQLEIQEEIHFPHSLGLLYSAFTYYLGFKVNSGEYKVMGLAPYGRPIYTDLIYEHLIDVAEDGSFWLDQRYFAYAHGFTMTNQAFADLFGQPVRTSEEEPLQDFHFDLAASIQQVTNEIVLKIGRHIAQRYQVDKLCLAGGVALNCVANGLLERSGLFKEVWVQPAAGDAGGALGAALAFWHLHLKQPRQPSPHDAMQGAYLGPEFTQKQINAYLDQCGAVYKVLPEDELYDYVAGRLSEDYAAGWFQGRMEFGPRALGNRSIIADPRSPKMQSVLNLKVKFRESFRPFAPSVLAEEAANWFEQDCPSPYMLMTTQVVAQHQYPRDPNLRGLEQLHQPLSSIPAVTHVDGSARVQTVHQETNPRYASLLQAFQRKTGCPILVNTSFNVRGEPIVHTPEDAWNCFMATHLDLLVLGNAVLLKTEQPSHLVQAPREFALD